MKKVSLIAGLAGTSLLFSLLAVGLVMEALERSNPRMLRDFLLAVTMGLFGLLLACAAFGVWFFGSRHRHD